MPSYPLYQVDAFADRLFAGNPAAVMVLDDWLPDATLQAIAAENNLSETAFLVPEDAAAGRWAIRWLTPTTEVPLCGHATLASAFVLFEHLGYAGEALTFRTVEAGDLHVRRGEQGRLVLDFPITKTRPKMFSDDLPRMIGARLLEVHTARFEGDLLAVVATPEEVRLIEPALGSLLRAGIKGLVVTAASDRPAAGEPDFVCRYFAPGHGIDEDPVTGSIHTFLVPFWAKRLNKTELVSHQVSPRGGVLHCALKGERVDIAGTARLYMKGEAFL